MYGRIIDHKGLGLVLGILATYSIITPNTLDLTSIHKNENLTAPKFVAEGVSQGRLNAKHELRLNLSQSS